MGIGLVNVTSDGIFEQFDIIVICVTFVRQGTKAKIYDMILIQMLFVSVSAADLQGIKQTFGIICFAIVGTEHV